MATKKYSTFLVLESFLLLLFGAYIFCGHSTTSLTKAVLLILTSNSNVQEMFENTCLGESTIYW